MPITVKKPLFGPDGKFYRMGHMERRRRNQHLKKLVRQFRKNQRICLSKTAIEDGLTSKALGTSVATYLGSDMKGQLLKVRVQAKGKTWVGRFHPEHWTPLVFPA